MKSISIVILGLTGLLALAMAEPPPVPPGHPATQPQLPAGHPDVRQAPMVGDPADVTSVDAVIDAFYESISGPRGQERDWNRFRSLFIGEARFISLKSQQDSAARPFAMTAEEYIKFNRNYFERGGYFETDVHREVDQYGGIAQVFSTYESRRAENADPYGRGINSFHLIFDGRRWWITTMSWQSEKLAGNPIPQEYLPESSP